MVCRPIAGYFLNVSFNCHCDCNGIPTNYVCVHINSQAHQEFDWLNSLFLKVFFIIIFVNDQPKCLGRNSELVLTKKQG